MAERDVVSRLMLARAYHDDSLGPAFSWAIHEAREAEFVAEHASNLALTGIQPVYPPIVLLLAEASFQGATDV